MCCVYTNFRRQQDGDVGKVVVRLLLSCSIKRYRGSQGEINSSEEDGRLPLLPTLKYLPTLTPPLAKIMAHTNPQKKYTSPLENTNWRAGKNTYYRLPSKRTENTGRLMVPEGKPCIEKHLALHYSLFSYTSILLVNIKKNGAINHIAHSLLSLVMIEIHKMFYLWVIVLLGKVFC